MIKNILTKLFPFCLIVVLLACNSRKNQPKQELKNGEYWVTIRQSAGSASSNSFLPYPANMAVINGNSKNEFLVLATSMPVEKELAVQAIGVLRLKEKSNERNIIISTPLDTALQLTPARSFQEFLIKNVGVKQIIQDWFLYEKGIGKTALIGWENESYAKKILKNQGNSTH